ncbi:MAG: FMN-binding protein [Muribaculaceae bacterium]|nr:FMN-binding protein [Muribaculaceae bacterium]
MKKTIIFAAIMLLVAGTVTLDARTKKASKAKKAPTTQVIYTGEIAKKVVGYNGTTPLNITIKNGVIENIEVLPNQESPGYLKRAKDKVLPQYIGKTVAQAKSLKPDIATGATYTSEALIKNIQMGLQQVNTSSSGNKKAPAKKASSKSKKRH